MNEHASSGAKERELLYQNTKPSAHTLMEEMGMGSGRGAVNKGIKRRKENKYCRAETQAVMETVSKGREMEERKRIRSNR